MSLIITVREMMSSSVVTLKPSMDMADAIRVLLKNKVSGATVVDDENQVVGILSEKDCLRIFVSGAYNSLPDARVADYMSKEVIVVDPDDDLFSVAELYLKHHFRRIPVVEEGKLIGQITRREILEGSRKIWEASPVKKEWTDAKYIPEEVQAKLDAKGS